MKRSDSVSCKDRAGVRVWLANVGESGSNAEASPSEHRRICGNLPTASRQCSAL